MIENPREKAKHEKKTKSVGGAYIMKHQTSRQVYDYWNMLRNGRDAPLRSELEPCEMKSLLPDIMILEQEDPLTYLFRLAGTRLCSHYGQELRGKNLLNMWARHERESIESLLFSVTEDAAAAVLGFAASDDQGREVAMEMILLPMKQENGARTRIFGSLAALDRPEWLGTAKLSRHSVRSLRLLWPDDAPRFTIDARAGQPLSDPPYGARMPARRRPTRLRVIEGGLHKS